MYSNEVVNKELKSLLSQFKDSYKMASESSRNEYMKTLVPGAEIPKTGVIYGDNRVREFESMCDGYRGKMKSIIADVSSDLKDKETEAPSTEAVNSITLLSMRKNVTEDEIDNLLTRYGDNQQAWRTINSIAKDHNIHVFRDHENEGKLSRVNDLEANLDRALSASSAISGHASDGYLSMIAMEIDNVFPVEE